MPGKHSRNEVSYYPEIQTFIEAQLKSNFKAKRHKELSVFWGIGELKTNLQRIIAEHPDKCTCVKNFANRVPPLNLDIFALVTDGTQFEILILEVKLKMVIAFCRKPIAWSLMISAKVPCSIHPEEATLPLRWLCQLPLCGLAAEERLQAIIPRQQVNIPPRPY